MSNNPREILHSIMQDKKTTISRNSVSAKNEITTLNSDNPEPPQLKNSEKKLDSTTLYTALHSAEEYIYGNSQQ